ncbi:MAG: hypothetical protein H6797_05885 [Candidatus Nomurabacteria bacterium]|nr:MAG: hypothetical protein H6797_05885 [Candidatus Nomurabacteria bacterium]
MQPNQQNSNQNGMPYQVPDYLHLDPATGQRSKSNKKLKLIFTVTLIILLVGGLGAAVFVWVQGVPEREFYQAIRQFANEKYIKIVADGTASSESLKIDMTTTSDFSMKSAPRVDVNYSVSVSKDSDAYGLNKGRVAGSLIALDSGDFYAKFSQIDNVSGTMAPNGLVQTGVWKHLSDLSKKADVSAYDPFGLRFTASTIPRYVFAGNFGDGVQSLLDIVKENNVYTIDGVNSGNDTDIYTIILNQNGLKTASLQVDKLLGRTVSYATANQQSGVVKVKFWINKTSGKITKLQNISDNKDRVPATTTMIITYPDTLSIKAPSE